MAREKKYKSKALFRKAVDKYFDSISRLEVVRVFDEESGEWRTAQNALGVRVHHLRYFVPPSLSALCLELGISRQTFANYAADVDGGYSAVCEYARLRIQAYLEEELKVRTKGLSGVIFDLQANFGWKEKREVALDSETRRDMKESLTMDEKLALIRAAAAALPPEEEEGEGEG